MRIAYFKTLSLHFTTKIEHSNIYIAPYYTHQHVSLPVILNLGLLFKAWSPICGSAKAHSESYKSLEFTSSKEGRSRFF